MPSEDTTSTDQTLGNSKARQAPLQIATNYGIKRYYYKGLLSG
jgi:hypothetical protein